VFDVGNRNSFDALEGWLDEAHRFGAPRSMVVCVAGTKADSQGSGVRRSVPEREARDWAAARGLPYFEVSAATGGSVNALFATLFAQVLSGTAIVPRDAVAIEAESAAAACTTVAPIIRDGGGVLEMGIGAVGAAAVTKVAVQQQLDLGGETDQRLCFTAAPASSSQAVLR